MEDNQRIIGLLDELVAWTKLSQRQTLVNTLLEVLDDPRHFKAYELTDGSRTQKEVADAVGLSQPAISGLWQRWRKVGIVRIVDGRVVHLAKPSDLSMSLPVTR